MFPLLMLLDLGGRVGCGYRVAFCSKRQRGEKGLPEHQLYSSTGLGSGCYSFPFCKMGIIISTHPGMVLQI